MKPILADFIIRRLQKKILQKTGGTGRGVNYFEPYNEPGRKVTVRGELYVNDICYANTYPNSFCDIWYPNEDTTVKRPTIFYFHGGGFFFGSKMMGDPLAAAASEDENFITELLAEGYNIVNADYALTPEYRFPVPIIQMNELFAFFTEHGAEFGIDMSQVVLMGGSAGADMSEIYGLAMTNEEYADKLGIKPVLKREQVKALIIDEAALSVDSFNFAMNVMMHSLMGTTTVKKGYGLLLDAARHIKGEYLPSFINSSNLEPWFPASAQDLKNAMDKFGPDYDYCYFEKEVDSLEHGYMNRFPTNACARECMDRVKKFIREHVEW